MDMMQGGDSTNDIRRQTLIDHTMFFGLDNHKRNTLGIKNEPELCHKVIERKRKKRIQMKEEKIDGE